MGSRPLHGRLRDLRVDQHDGPGRQDAADGERHREAVPYEGPGGELPRRNAESKRHGEHAVTNP